jgi:2-polyprenyl-3-methyl-5-hydroxy-6-metoxy-1,4-benzoquinol methylase
MMAAAFSASTTNDRLMVSCRSCGGRNETTYLLSAGYRIARCEQCGLWYVNPQPTVDELSQFYAMYDDGEQWRSREEDFNRGVRKAILRFASSGSLLDAGCGSGDFLRCMREVGFQVNGIEPSETGCSWARETHGIEVFQGMLEDYLTASNRSTFEVVSLLNVLEHLRDPKEMLMQLRKLIKPNGILAVVVPDARFHDFIGRLRGAVGIADPYWLEQSHSVLSGFKLPDHLSSFQPRTISFLLEQCGFEVLRVQNAPVVLNPNVFRNALKASVRYVGQTLYYLSLRNFTFGYSTLVICKKPQQ